MKLLVLALSWLLVLCVESFYSDLLSHAYYLLLAGTCFILFMLCVDSKSTLIAGYAYIQLIAMIIYVQMITPTGFYLVDSFMYGGVINYANVILLYEMVLFVGGVRDVYNAIHRYYNDSHMYSYRSE